MVKVIQLRRRGGRYEPKYDFKCCIFNYPALPVLGREWLHLGTTMGMWDKTWRVISKREMTVIWE